MAAQKNTGAKTAKNTAKPAKAAKTKAPAAKTVAGKGATPESRHSSAKAARPAPSRVAKPIKELKPGWTARVFGIETGTLVACDAHWNSTNWERGDKFTFLYRSKRGKFFVLHDVQSWSIATEADAKKLYAELPEKLVPADKAFEPIVIPPVPKSRDEDEDPRTYKVVRNDKWDFSIWLDYKEMPAGWYHVGITGDKRSCLEFIEQNCVFSAPNPGMP